MEFVDGQPLSERIKEAPLSVDEVDLLRRRIAPGLHAAHLLGIVHRDVSPDNIILPGGSIARAKIIDFGIARSSLLGEGTVIGSGFAGKYNYVSPEQLGLFGGDVTGRSDMYSFALVLAEALAGKPLDMGGSQVQILDKRRRLPDLSGIDARIRPLLARMLAPDPADRFADMSEVAAWQAQTTPAKAAGGGGGSATRLVAGIAALALLAGGGFYGWTLLNDKPKPGGAPPPALTENRSEAAAPAQPPAPAAAPPANQPKVPELVEPPAVPSPAVATPPAPSPAPATPANPPPALTSQEAAPRPSGPLRRPRRRQRRSPIPRWRSRRRHRLR